jgi:hypothetical protein
MLSISKRAYVIALLILGCILAIKLFTSLAGLPLSGEYVSPSIKESKENGAFVAEYVTPSNPYKINDTLVVHIKEAWLEKDSYFNGQTRRITIQDNGYQLLINAEENDLERFGISWNILTKDGRYFYGHNAIPIVQDFDSPLADTLQYRVENDSHVIIGKFILIKKKSN